MILTRQRSVENFGLQSAALQGDYDAVRRALEEGADINALDAQGRTVLMCAVAGNRYVDAFYTSPMIWLTRLLLRWDDVTVSHEALLTDSRLKIIRLLVSRPDITLFTLNAPQEAFRGVTPIGIAAWLNLYTVVQVLLEGSLHAVSVDGMDTHGATSLMCKQSRLFSATSTVIPLF